MTPREKLIEKVAEKLARITGCGNCDRPVNIATSEIGRHFYTCNECGYICEERLEYEINTAKAEAIIDYLQIQPDKFGDVKFNIYHILDEEPKEITPKEILMEMHQILEKKGKEFLSPEELLKMREQ